MRRHRDVWGPVVPQNRRIVGVAKSVIAVDRRVGWPVGVYNRNIAKARVVAQDAVDVTGRVPSLAPETGIPVLTIVTSTRFRRVIGIASSALGPGEPPGPGDPGGYIRGGVHIQLLWGSFTAILRFPATPCIFFISAFPLRTDLDIRLHHLLCGDCCLCSATLPPNCLVGHPVHPALILINITSAQYGLCVRSAVLAEPIE